MTDNEIRPVKDIERGSDHVEEKPVTADVNHNDVGYKEYLESLDIEISPKEERWVRWKLDVGCLPVQFLMTLSRTFQLTVF